MDRPSKTDLELFRRVETDGVGTESNIAQHLDNIDEVSKRVRIAEDAGCFIEVISIRLQLIDFWLRIYFFNVPNNNDQREREFGPLLKQTFKLGLDKDLYDDLLTFNKIRVDAIHGYIIGTILYKSISAVAKDVDDLVRRTIEFVVRNSGSVVTKRGDLVANPGTMTIHVEDFCDEIRSGVRY